MKSSKEHSEPGLGPKDPTAGAESRRLGGQAREAVFISRASRGSKAASLRQETDGTQQSEGACRERGTDHLE